MKTTEVAPSSPFKQEMLSLDDCYILDNGKDGNMFVWKGDEKVGYIFTSVSHDTLTKASNSTSLFFLFCLRFVARFLLSGSKANTEERKAAMKVAQDFIKEKKYSSKTQVHCSLVQKTVYKTQHDNFRFF